MRPMFGIVLCLICAGQSHSCRGPLQYRAAAVWAQVSWMKLHDSKRLPRHAAFANASTGRRPYCLVSRTPKAGPADGTSAQL